MTKPKPMVQVLFKCQCLSTDAVVHVRCREDDEDIVDWVENAVRVEIGNVHRLMSPRCREAKMEYVKIPVSENAPYIGAEPKLNS